jgi:hypothetical protein
MPPNSVGLSERSKENRLCVQVMSTAVGRVVKGTLALVHASGALEPLTFLNLNPSIQDLEYLASVITAHIQRTQVTAGTRSEHRVGKEGTALLAKTGTEDAIVIENELQPSALIDICQQPGFVDTALSGTSPPQHPAAQQAALLKRLSAWDSDGYALLRTAPRLISHRVTARCDSTAQTITVTIAPDNSELQMKACLWDACFLASLYVLLPLGLVLVVIWVSYRAKSSSETHEQEKDDFKILSITFSALMLVLMLTVNLVGHAFLDAPRDVTLTVGTTGWKLESHLKGLKIFPFCQSTSTGETNACCGCRVCAFCLPPLHNLQAHPNNHSFVWTIAGHETRSVLKIAQPCCLLLHLNNSSAAVENDWNSQAHLLQRALPSPLMPCAEQPTHPSPHCVPTSHCRPPPDCAPAFCLFPTVIPASEVRW